MKEGYIYILKVSLMQPTPSEIEPFRVQGTELLEFALFQRLYEKMDKNVLLCPL